MKGYEGLYEVSSFGRVRSLDRYQKRQFTGSVEFYQHYKGRMMKQQLTNKGYYVVMLNLHRNHDLRIVSRLVAEAFIPNPDNLPVVNHKDQNTKNNHADNLEWCTIQYNATYADAIQRRVSKMVKPIEQLTLDGKHVAYFESKADAARKLGYHTWNIFRVLHGKAIQYKGYKWRYVT